MDIYGAFQLCSIAILAAPVTVNLSQTYFNNPARNIIYLWTGLILAGLLSLTIEFYRANPEPCIEDGNLVTLKSNSFKYGTTMCSLTAICASDALPFSPMRRDAADDIFVIPAPTVLSFGTGTLMAAGCCIPAILSLLMMWDRIQRINWVRRWGRHNEPNLDERIRGTRATVGLIRQVEGKSRRVLMIVYVVFFGGAVLAIILLGELNFWSEPVRFQSEPFASIGKHVPAASPRGAPPIMS